jgi:hypothetical protein
MQNVIILVLYSPLFNCLEKYKVQNVNSIYITTGNIVPMHAMEACGDGGIDSVILKLCIRL